MRRIGSIESETQAIRFQSYLLADGIECRVDREGDASVIWVFDEDRLPAARAALEDFKADPHASQFADRAQEFEQQRQEELSRQLAARKARLQPRRRSSPSALAAPVTFTVIVLCGMVAAATQFGKADAMRHPLMLSLWRNTSGRIQTPLPEVRDGQVWRLVTPSLLHFSLLHLLGNCAWFYVLGRMIEAQLGRWWYIGLLLSLSILSNLAEGLLSGPNFGGLSGVVSGVFGFVWFKSQFARQEGYDLAPESAVFFIGWLLICLTGAVGPIANTAHLSGLGAGILLAMVDRRPATS